MQSSLSHTHTHVATIWSNHERTSSHHITIIIVILIIILRMKKTMERSDIPTSSKNRADSTAIEKDIIKHAFVT